jgi:hypothetical protein
MKVAGSILLDPVPICPPSVRVGSGAGLGIAVDEDFVRAHSSTTAA